MMVCYGCGMPIGEGTSMIEDRFGHQWCSELCMDLYFRDDLEKPSHPRPVDATNPDHYRYGEIECIDAIEAQMSRREFIGYLRGNIAKYLWRYEHKNGVEDLKKARWYLNRLISTLEPQDAG